MVIWHRSTLNLIVRSINSKACIPGVYTVKIVYYFTGLNITPWGVAVHGFHGNISVNTGITALQEKMSSFDQFWLPQFFPHHWTVFSHDIY